jgi:hypothetical protein
MERMGDSFFPVFVVGNKQGELILVLLFPEGEFRTKFRVKITVPLTRLAEFFVEGVS